MGLPLIGTIVNALSGVADKFIRTPDEKDAFELEASKLIQARDSEIEQTHRTEIQAKERIIVAEMSQGDKFTKRARPSIIYAGLLLVAVNHVILPWIAFYTGSAPPSIEIPAMFWTAWGGIAATWVVGRSFEKKGIENKVVSLITGNK